MTALIEIKDLTTKIGTFTLHQHLDMELMEGEVLGLVGGSGTGKSVLLNMILGLMTPYEGSVKMLGCDVHHDPSSALTKMKKQIGVLFQSSALFSDLTLFENVRMPMVEHMKLPKKLMDEMVAMKLALVGLTKKDFDKSPAELSGGMLKRAGLARALVLDPKILLLDEPTAGLDPISAARFDELILHVQESLKLSVLMVTHDLDSLKAICNRIAVLVDQKIVSGTIQTLVKHKHPWIKEYFNGTRSKLV